MDEWQLKYIFRIGASWLGSSTYFVYSLHTPPSEKWQHPERDKAFRQWLRTSVRLTTKSLKNSQWETRHHRKNEVATSASSSNARPKSSKPSVPSACKCSRNRISSAAAATVSVSRALNKWRETERVAPSVTRQDSP